MKIFSLNIEGINHFERFIPVILQEQPDVICLQEVFEADIAFLERTFSMKGFFAPVARLEFGGNFAHIGEKGSWGIALFSKKVDSPPLIEYYFGSVEVPVLDQPECGSRPLICADILDRNGTIFKVISTHFTWSPDGEINEAQSRDAIALKRLLASKGEFVLCGDLNAPSGRAAFALLSEGLIDWLPSELNSTLDPVLHRYGSSLQLVVDALLTTPGLTAESVRVISGVSDHRAVVAEISLL